MKNKILTVLAQEGIEEVGFCPFSYVEQHLLPCRALGRLPKNAQTVVMMAFPYRVLDKPPRYLSRYAAVPDYHAVLAPVLSRACEKLSALFPENTFVSFQDNSPIPEVHTAAAAGLGVVGKNGLLITKKYGSWVFLGEIVTDLPVFCEPRVFSCLACNACLTACPKKNTGMDCLSAVTQKKGDLTEAEQNALVENGLLWGCDRCADVCPMNRGVQIKPFAGFREGYRETYTPGESAEGRPYAWRGKQPISRNAELLQKKERLDR